MRKTTHILGGIITAGGIYLALNNSMPPESIIALAAGSIAGSLIPDIDHPNSTVSNNAKALRVMYRIGTIGNPDGKHRGMMHSILFCIPWILMAIFISNGIARFAFIGISAGYLSHLLLDCFNPAGCPLFYPFKKRISLGKIRTGGIGEILFAITECIVITATIAAPYITVLI